MAASAERGPEIGLGALRNRGGLCGYVRRRARSGHVRGSNSATAEFARRRRSADDLRGTGFTRNLPNSQPADCVVKVPRWGRRALSHCFWQFAWNRSELRSR